MQDKKYHRILQRQIKKALGRKASIPEEYEELFRLISESYEHNDKDRYMLERSVDLSSQELVQRNAELLQQKQELENTLEELRTTQVQLHESEKMASLSEELQAANEELTAQREKLASAFDDLQEAQAQLVQNEKMSSLGQLTAGVAHEINNPINFIYGGIQALKPCIDDLLSTIKAFVKLAQKAEQYETKDALLRELRAIHQQWEKISDIEGDISVLIKDISSGADRTATIVKSLRNFSRSEDMESRLADIHEGINSTLLILNSQITEKMQILKEYDPQLLQVECYASSLNQVFMNIIANAIQAMNGEGKLTITTSIVGEMVNICIADNGPGIPEAIRSQIFNPFFTTKEIGEGTGLGLSISYGIIQKHHGEINVESKVGEGTCFTIIIPQFLKK